MSDELKVDAPNVLARFWGGVRQVQIDEDAQQRLIPIEGQPPDLSALPATVALTSAVA